MNEMYSALITAALLIICWYLSRIADILADYVYEDEEEEQP